METDATRQQQQQQQHTLPSLLLLLLPAEADLASAMAEAPEAVIMARAVAGLSRFFSLTLYLTV